MPGLNFIELEDITEPKDQPQVTEEDENLIEELGKRLSKAEALYRQKREVHDYMLEDGLELEKLINEEKAENRHLINKVKELQHQVAEIRKRRVKEEEEENEDVEATSKSRSIYMRKMERENQKLRRENENVAAELDRLLIREEVQEQMHQMRGAEQALKDKLEHICEILRSKDDEIDKKSTDLVNKQSEIQEYFSTIEDLRWEKRDLQEQLSSRLAMEDFPEDSAAGGRRQLGVSTWWCYAKGLQKGTKAAVATGLCALLPLGILVSMAPVCSSPDPDCSLWSTASSLLEPTFELQYTSLSVF